MWYLLLLARGSAGGRRNAVIQHFKGECQGKETERTPEVQRWARTQIAIRLCWGHNSTERQWTPTSISEFSRPRCTDSNAAGEVPDQPLVALINDGDIVHHGSAPSSPTTFACTSFFGAVATLMSSFAPSLGSLKPELLLRFVAQYPGSLAPTTKPSFSRSFA